MGCQRKVNIGTSCKVPGRLLEIDIAATNMAGPAMHINSNDEVMNVLDFAVSLNASGRSSPELVETLGEGDLERRGEVRLWTR